jgi:diguanylate cyclase (GGDEF)-like protein
MRARGRDDTRMYARVISSRFRATGASVLLAAVLIGLSAGAASWAVETGITRHERSHRLGEVRGVLREARVLLGRREQSASRRAARLAARRDVQAAFVERDAGSLVALAHANRDVGFVLWDGRTVGRVAAGIPSAALSIYSHGQLAGRVVVTAEPDQALLERARAASPGTHMLYAASGRIAAASPRTGDRPVADALRHTVNDSEPVGTGAGSPSILYAFTAGPSIPGGALWPFLIGLGAAALSFRLFGLREATRRAEPPPNTVRDAVALVGETLAATHNPEALLPVILQAAVEATDAAGGTIRAGEATLAARGTAGGDAIETIEVPLEVSEGRSAVMRLHPGPAGFGPEAKDAAAWIAAQAVIALENARLHGQVQRQAVTDELTGLANRRRFLAQLDTEVTRCRRNGSSLGIILADLDDFKRVNDTYGHDAGDEALRGFAAILQGTVRDVDLPVRLGGEEFAVLVPDTDLDGSVQLAERIRRALESMQAAHSGAEIRLTASFGVSCFPTAASAEDLLSDADRRLYDAKRRGKNMVVASSGHGPVATD